MTFVQVVPPNPNIPCEPGWCLDYVRRTFKALAVGATATEGWKLTQFKHADQNFPSGVAVPVWFSLSDEPAGHVALRMGDGSYYSTSSPTSKTPIHHPNLAHLLNYYGGRLTVRGWSEDIGSIRVVKEDDMKNTRERIIAVFNAYLGTQPTEADIEYWKKETMTALDDNAASTLRDQNRALQARVAELEKQVAAGSKPVEAKALEPGIYQVK